MKNKRSFIGIGILAVAVGIVGSLAYFSQDLVNENEFKTARYDTSIEEEFIPPTTWVPGVEVNKDVVIQNNGNVDVVVKATLEEMWRKDNKTLNNQIIDDNGNYQDAVMKILPNVVVYKPNMDLATTIGKWVQYENTYYYMNSLTPMNKTTLLLDGVILNPLLENTVTHKSTTVTTDENGQKVTYATMESNEYGYDDANYKLTIKATTIQATARAIKTWGDNPVVNYIANHYATIAEK